MSSSKSAVAITRFEGAVDASTLARYSRIANAFDGEAYATGVPGRFQRPPMRRTPSPLKARDDGSAYRRDGIRNARISQPHLMRSLRGTHARAPSRPRSQAFPSASFRLNDAPETGATQELYLRRLRKHRAPRRALFRNVKLLAAIGTRTAARLVFVRLGLARRHLLAVFIDRRRQWRRRGQRPRFPYSATMEFSCPFGPIAPPFQPACDMGAKSLSESSVARCALIELLCGSGRLLLRRLKRRDS